MDLTDLMSRVRLEIGDSAKPFRDIVQCDGETVWFDLSRKLINSSDFTVTVINGATVTDLSPTADYSMDWDDGIITLNVPPPNLAQVLFTGSSYGMFSDAQLVDYVADGVRWHVYNHRYDERFRDAHGWITYRDTPIALANLPRIEEPLLIMRCTINVLWVLANDAATDVNVQTAEGTVIDRSARYRQLMQQIELLNERYINDCMQLNVGPYRVEVLNVRRVSQTTGRLVPLMTEREYDDHRYPSRKLPPIDKRDEDNSGVPSQIWYGNTI